MLSEHTDDVHRVHLWVPNSASPAPMVAVSSLLGLLSPLPPSWCWAMPASSLTLCPLPWDFCLAAHIACEPTAQQERARQPCCPPRSLSRAAGSTTSSLAQGSAETAGWGTGIGQRRIFSLSSLLSEWLARILQASSNLRLWGRRCCGDAASLRAPCCPIWCWKLLYFHCSVISLSLGLRKQPNGLLQVRFQPTLGSLAYICSALYNAWHEHRMLQKGLQQFLARMALLLTCSQSRGAAAG